jgi:phosphopantetheinyl transferase (holo-ACP synthase)
MLTTMDSEFTPSLPVPLRDVLPEGTFIHGMGVDVTQVGPFRRRPPTASDAFYGLIFTEAERAYCATEEDAAAALAACFAAKKAAVKALSTRHLIKAPQIEVIPVPAQQGRFTARLVSKQGEPVPAFDGEMLVIMQRGGDVAVAFVIAHGSAATVTEVLDTQRHDRTAVRRSLGSVATHGREIVFSPGRERLRSRLNDRSTGPAAS